MLESSCSVGPPSILKTGRPPGYRVIFSWLALAACSRCPSHALAPARSALPRQRVRSLARIDGSGGCGRLRELNLSRRRFLCQQRQVADDDGQGGVELQRCYWRPLVRKSQQFAEVPRSTCGMREIRGMQCSTVLKDRANGATGALATD